MIEWYIDKFSAKSFCLHLLKILDTVSLCILSDNLHFYDDRLALLWFHTIVRPFFGLDGSNSRSGADAAQRLIDGAKPEFAEASLFLFFQGRVNRLKVYSI